MSFSHNYVGERFFCYDDVTSCGDVSSRVFYSCDLEVRNKCKVRYVQSSVDNWKTKQMLNFEYLKLKIKQMCPAKPKVH